jgi:hypothetical protein
MKRDIRSLRKQTLLATKIKMFTQDKLFEIILNKELTHKKHEKADLSRAEMGD